MLNSSVHAASTAASTTGRYSGRQPAITALIATFSTVHSTRSGGTTATTSSGRAVGAGEHAHDARRGRRHEREAVGPAALVHRLGVVLLVAERDPARAWSRARADGVARARGDRGVLGARAAARAVSGQSGAERRSRPVRASQLLAAPADGAADLDAVVDSQQRRDGVEIEGEAHSRSVSSTRRRVASGSVGSSCE